MLYPALGRARNVLETGFANMNALAHPVGMIMNAGWIEHTVGDFYFYREGLTDSIGQVIEAIDAERRHVADALGIRTRSMLEMSRDTGFISDEDLQMGKIAAAWRGSKMPSGIKSPSSLMDRYILEDVSFGLVPFSELGKLAGVPTPTIDAIVHLASVATGTPLRQDGLTLDRMGLTGARPEDLAALVG